MSQAAIEIRGLTKRFKNFALGPLDLTVPAGSIYAFVGPNGAGKTTTIDLIFGMGAAEAGTITVLGLDHRRDEVAMKRQVGYANPDLSMFAFSKVGRIIRFVRGFYRTWDDDYCDKLLEQFGVRRDERLSALSFGSKTKLGLILAMSWRPTVLVLDEPTVGLDAIARQQVFAELLSIVENDERTVFISSHNLTDLERFADHVGMIRGGQMMFEGPMADVVDRFRMLDVVAWEPSDVLRQPGFFVQQHASDRWRVLVDNRVASPEAVGELTANGANRISEAPVTLEELFIALGR